MYVRSCVYVGMGYIYLWEKEKGELVNYEALRFFFVFLPNLGWV